jgi:hypothetical protein
VEFHIVYPHPLVVLSCAAAFGVGYIIRWAIDQTDIDFEDRLRRFFNRE